MSFLLHWLITAAGLYAAAHFLTGVSVASPLALALGALVLGLVNAVVRPILQILSLPFTLLTLGLFYFVVNGLAFGLAALLVPGFRVATLWSAILGALIVSLVSWAFGALTRPARPVVRGR
jgi:putative membrane protein